MSTNTEDLKNTNETKNGNGEKTPEASKETSKETSELPVESSSNETKKFKKFYPQASWFDKRNMEYLAYCSDLAYLDRKQSKKKLEELGFSINNHDHFFNMKETDTQGFIVGDDEKIIIAFRGSESILIDFLATNPATIQDYWIPTNSDIKVHRGFKRAFEAVWNPPVPIKKIQKLKFIPIKESLDKLLAKNKDLPIWITGHSLGGALATLACATIQLLQHKDRESEVQKSEDKKNKDRKYKLGGVYTFGQPRVGNDNFAEALNESCKNRFFRVVNNNDPVPFLPSQLARNAIELGTDAVEGGLKLTAGAIVSVTEPLTSISASDLDISNIDIYDIDSYKHAGTKIYFDVNGKKHVNANENWGMPSIEQLLSVVAGTLDNLVALEFLGTDHSMDEYLKLVKNDNQ